MVGWKEGGYGVNEIFAVRMHCKKILNIVADQTR